MRRELGCARLGLRLRAVDDSRMPARGLASAPAHVVLAQALVDGGNEKHVPEHDDGEVGGDDGEHDQLDEHSSPPATWSMVTASPLVGRTSTSACAASRAWSA